MPDTWNRALSLRVFIFDSGGRKRPCVLVGLYQNVAGNAKYKTRKPTPLSLLLSAGGWASAPG
jgi:hypothetical protein